MSIEVRAARTDRREVRWLVGREDVPIEDEQSSVWVSVTLSDDDRFDLTKQTWTGRDEGLFQVWNVNYPDGMAIRNVSIAPSLDSRVRARGRRYNMDGSVGKRQAERSIDLKDLPGAVQKAVIEGWEEVGA